MLYFVSLPLQKRGTHLKKYWNKSKMYLLVLRGISVGAKFFFTTLYFQYSESAFGAYSLLATTLFLLIFLMGLDFYTYANRAVLEPGSNPQKIIFNQFIFYTLLYALLYFPVKFIFMGLNFAPDLFYLFYAVLITEHLNFEFYRLFFVFKKPLAANWNLFFRNGLWVLLAAGYLLWYHSINLPVILKLWLAGNLLALLFSFSVIWIKRYKVEKQNLVLDKQWILKGLVVSAPYILGSLAYKTIEFSDRYLIDYFMDKTAVGVYSFFANMANVLNIVLFTLVVSVLYPGLVESIMHTDKIKFQKIYRQFKKEILLTAAGVGGVLVIVLPILLVYIQKEKYLQDFYVFLLLLGANILLNLSFLYHFIIYAYKKDWKIFKATAWGALLNIILNIVLIPLMGIGGAALATFVSFALVAFLKYLDAKQLKLLIRNNNV